MRSSRGFSPKGRKGMSMKNIIISDIVYPIIYGAIIGLTIGIADVSINTPFNPSLFLTV
jgi:hypothetical protein